MREFVERIRKNSPLAFEKWREKTGLSGKERFKVDSDNIQIITDVPSKTVYKGEDQEYNTYPFQNFFHYFEGIDIYGYVVLFNRNPQSHIISNTICWANNVRKSPYYWKKDQRTECQRALFEECFRIHNKQLEDKC